MSTIKTGGVSTIKTGGGVSTVIMIRNWGGGHVNYYHDLVIRNLVKSVHYYHGHKQELRKGCQLLSESVTWN